MTMNLGSFGFLRGALTLALLGGAGTMAAQMQPVEAKPAVTGFSSSADSQVADNQIAALSNPFEAMKTAQPAPRKYGRPRYRGGNTNADGSNKYAFLVGGGFTQPIGNTYHYSTPSYSFQAGVGRNFSRQLGVLLQVDYDNFGYTARTLSGQTYIYNKVFGAGSVSGLDGNNHIWSVTLNPTINVIPADNGGVGMYVVAGVGFYHKAAHFFVPTAGYCYDPYYGGYYQCTANQDIDKYVSNAPGVNGGIGFTYKVSRFSGQHLYGEVRYVYTANQQRSGITVQTAAFTAAQQAATNFFPANSNRTTYFPVKFGIRF